MIFQRFKIVTTSSPVTNDCFVTSYQQLLFLPFTSNFFNEFVGDVYWRWTTDLVIESTTADGDFVVDGHVLALLSNGLKFIYQYNIF